MDHEKFQSLKCGDLVCDDASGEVFMVNQVRHPGYYAVVRVDPNTTERISNQLTVLASAEGRTLVSRKGTR